VTVHKSNARAACLSSSLLAILMLGACGSSESQPAAKEQGSPSVTLELPAPEPYREVSIPEAPPESADEAAKVAADDATAATPPETTKTAPAEKKPPEKAPEKKAAEKKADEKERSAASASAAVEEKEAAKAERNKSDTDTVPTRSGRPPLGDTEIARTIDRIGFPCGRVVSSEAVGSGQGTYKINCSSGEAYQGTTKRGHLFFRPWTGKLERD
jgi:outer membrane biosynthesis protein TonB